MDIKELFAYIEKNPGQFPNTIRVMQEVALEVLNIWKTAANFSAAVTVKQGGTGWFGKNYIYQGNIEISQKSPFRFDISYNAGSGGKIDFEQIVEEGRNAYNIAQNLLANSSKVRISPVRKTKSGKYISGGKKYLIVPLPNSGEHEKAPSFDMSIMDTFSEPAVQGDKKDVKRNVYDYKPIEGITRNNTARFTQKIAGGRTQATSKNLVMITDKSRWNPYPAVKGTKFSKKMQRVADAKINAASGRIISALDTDLKRLGMK